LIGIDLYAGRKGWSKPAERRGHHFLSIDWDERFDVDVHADILMLTKRWFVKRGFGKPDIILASPPCESYSVGSFRHHWLATCVCVCGRKLERVSGERWEHIRPTVGHRAKPVEGTFNVEPKSETGVTGQALLRKTLEIIEWLQPLFFVIENPRALMRRMPELEHLERRTVTYCQYGKHYMKPTDLWGGFPKSLKLKPPCVNGAPCHESAPRGARTGTQGLTTEEAGEIPSRLASAVIRAAEKDLANA
jgi:site-specific DNA-cytosine methylase